MQGSTEINTAFNTHAEASALDTLVMASYDKQQCNHAGSTKEQVVVEKLCEKDSEID